MKNKNLILVIVILGLAVGGFFAIQIRDHSGHYEAPRADHGKTTHSMDVADYPATLDQYFAIQTALGADLLADAKEAAGLLAVALGEESTITHIAHGIHQASDIETARAAFEALSEAIEGLVVHHGRPNDMTIEKYHCPMVDGNRGASWLQNKKGTINPYFGAKMLHCGTHVKTL